MPKKNKKTKTKKALNFIRSISDDKDESFLKKIHVHNFKSFEKDTTIDLSPKINLIFGKNSSGKSSIFQSLRLFRQSSASELAYEPPSYYRERGGIDIDIGYKGLVSGGKIKKNISLGVTTGIYKEKQVKSDVTLINSYAYIDKFYKAKNLISNKTILKSIYFSNNNLRFVIDLPSYSFLNKKNRSGVAYDTSFFDRTPKSSEGKFGNIYPGFYYKAEIFKKYSELKILDNDYIAFSKIDKKNIIKLLKDMIIYDGFTEKKDKNISYESTFHTKQAEIQSLRRRYSEEVIRKKLDSTQKIKWLLKNRDYYKVIFDEMVIRRNKEEDFKRELAKFIVALNQNKLSTKEKFKNYFLDDLIKKNKDLILFEGEFKTKLKDSEGPVYYQFESNLLYHLHILSIIIVGRGSSRLMRNITGNFLSLYNKSQIPFFGTGETIQENIQKIFDKMLILPGLRSLPKRYFVKGLQTNYVGPQAENLAELLANPKIRRETNRWLKILDVPYNVGVRASGNYYEIVFSNPKDTNHLISQRHIGLGYPMILPFIVQCLIAENKIIVIEEPETHLHPMIEADLAELVIESSIKRNNQFIIETHSEDFLLRLLKNIRLKKISTNEVSINYVRKPKNTSIVDKIIINESGQYTTPWRDDLFKERRENYNNKKKRT